MLSKILNMEPVIENLKQGTPEWKAKRLESFTASEAAAMMNCPTAFMTRSELLKMKATGEEKPVSSFMQKIFDEGHAKEALARPFIERRELNAGLAFYPVTLSKGRLLASMDGLAMDALTLESANIAWEHKAIVNSEKTYDAACQGDIPEHYKWQLDQQLMVSGAEFAMYTVSDGTEGKEITLLYHPDHERFQMLLDGWERFVADLENYDSTSIAAAELPAAEFMPMPQIVTQVEMKTVNDNMNEYRRAADEFVEKAKTELSTDQDVVDAIAVVKYCTAAEKTLKGAKLAVLSSIPSLGALFDGMDETTKVFSKLRLKLDKLVKVKKAQKKSDMIADALDKVVEVMVDNDLSDDHIETMMGLLRPILAESIKGKKTTQGAQDALDAQVAELLSSPPEIPEEEITGYDAGFAAGIEAAKQYLIKNDVLKKKTFTATIRGITELL